MSLFIVPLASEFIKKSAFPRIRIVPFSKKKGSKGLVHSGTALLIKHILGYFTFPPLNV